MPWGTTVRLPRRAVRAVVAGAIGGLAMFALEAPATAQNSIVETSPADGSEVTTQPAAIVMTFENEVPEQREVQVVCEGQPVQLDRRRRARDDGVTLTVPLQQALPAGDCTVAWTLSATMAASSAAISASR